jgi:hypothetical protein
MLSGCALIAFGPALALFWMFIAPSAQLVVLMVGRLPALAPSNNPIYLFIFIYSLINYFDSLVQVKYIFIKNMVTQIIMMIMKLFINL